MLPGEPVIGERLRGPASPCQARPGRARPAARACASRALATGVAWLGALGLGALAIACEDEPAPGPRTDSPPPTERLHAPGELRLTSAGKPPRLRLRYRLAPGQHQTFRTVVRLEHRAVGAAARLATEFDWERTVLTTSGKNAELQMKVRRVRRVSPESLRDSVAPRLSALLLKTTMDPRGRALSVTPPEALPAPGGEAVFGRFTAPLPEDPVGEGATWERLEPWSLTLPRTHQSVGLGVRTRYRLAFVLVRGEPKRARITADLRFHLVHTRQKVKAKAVVTGAGKGSAEWELDLVRGEPTTSRSEVELDLQVAAAGRSQRVQQRLECRTRPIRPSPGPRRPPAR